MNRLPIVVLCSALAQVACATHQAQAAAGAPRADGETGRGGPYGELAEALVSHIAGGPMLDHVKIGVDAKGSFQTEKVRAELRFVP